MSIQSFDALQKADWLYNNGKALEALAVLQPSIREMSENYWANFLIAKILASIGLEEGVSIYLRKAINTGDKAKIGAVAFLVARQLREENIDSACLMDEVINGDDEAGQNQYYLHKIHFMRAIIYLLEENISAADLHLQKAYNLVSYMPAEFEFNTLKIRSFLSSIDLSERPYLNYLKYRFNCNNNVIDYSANLSQMPDDTFVVEIGAMDGIKFDPLRGPITERGWNALLVEPLTDMFLALQNNYRSYPNVICCNVAITENSGPVKMYRVPTSEVEQEDGHDYVAGISSMHKTFLIERSGDKIVEETVEGITFDSISQRYSINKIDVLQIDTEGHDLVVLENVNLEKWKIPLVQIEILNLMPPDRLKVFNILDKNGYQHYFDGSDVVARI